jgi:hypothetical protein
MVRVRFDQGSSLRLGVDEAAGLPDLPVGGGLDLDPAHLHHGLPEPGLELAPGEQLHQRLGVIGIEQRRVGVEEHLVPEHVLEVLLVEVVGGLEVLHHRVVGAGGRRAGGLQLGGERGVHVGGVAGREAVGEGRAVGAADAVRAGEHDHVLGVEALAGEAVLELVDVEEGWGQVDQGLVRARDGLVVAARRHVEVGHAVAEEVGRVAAGEGHDVGTGDDARAGRLELRLGRVDHLEAAQAREVGNAELLRLRVGFGGLEQDGGVAALNAHASAHMSQ